MRGSKLQIPFVDAVDCNRKVLKEESTCVSSHFMCLLGSVEKTMRYWPIRQVISCSMYHPAGVRDSHLPCHIQDTE